MDHWLSWVIFAAIVAGVLFVGFKFVIPKLKAAKAENDAKDAATPKVEPTVATAPVAPAVAPATPAPIIIPATQSTPANSVPQPVTPAAPPPGNYSVTYATPSSEILTAPPQTAATSRVALPDPLPNPWMPGPHYISTAALLFELKQHPEWTQQMRVNGSILTHGGGPGADYTLNADGSIDLGRRQVNPGDTAAPAPQPPLPPVPINPQPQTPPEPPKPPPTETLEQYALTHGYFAALSELKAFAEKNPGMPHEQTIAAFNAYQAQPPAPVPPPVVTPDTPFIPSIDARILTDDDWEYYGATPRTWGLVYGDRNYIANKIQDAFARTKGSYAHPESYNGVLRLA